MAPSSRGIGPAQDERKFMRMLVLAIVVVTVVYTSAWDLFAALYPYYTRWFPLGFVLVAWVFLGRKAPRWLQVVAGLAVVIVVASLAREWHSPRLLDLSSFWKVPDGR